MLINVSSNRSDSHKKIRIKKSLYYIWNVKKVRWGLLFVVCALKADVQKLIDKVKAVVAEGNADRVQILKDDEIVFSVPVNVGIVGGILGFAAAPWALIAGAVAAFGLGCKLVVVKKDETKDEVK
ncbi:DUF4342 domain-containing protein [Butyrivibrio sp. WCE2006]|uniref:DUF4342 domain-containing protein n=1 Tax=Butyrivibrio sp. WCE2006 TaxID=1410611 RepID=UPI0009DDC4C0|nr:DUF4342 domain-containing protein [Butyrivibrio sp. WCE2006]